MIGYIQKKLVTLILSCVLIMPCYVRAARVVPEYADLVAGLIPIVLSSVVASYQRLPGPRLTIFGGGVFVGTSLFAALRRYTPNRILYEGQGLIEELDCGAINHIFRSEKNRIEKERSNVGNYVPISQISSSYNKEDITKLIKQIPCYPFSKAEAECDKYLPIIDKQIFWVKKTGSESNNAKSIQETLEIYQHIMRIISGIINENRAMCNDEKKRQTSDINIALDQEGKKTDEQIKKLEAKSRWYDSFTRFLTMPGWRYVLYTAASLPTLYIIFKVTLSIARFV